VHYADCTNDTSHKARSSDDLLLSGRDWTITKTLGPNTSSLQLSMVGRSLLRMMCHQKNRRDRAVILARHGILAAPNPTSTSSQYLLGLAACLRTLTAQAICLRPIPPSRCPRPPLQLLKTHHPHHSSVDARRRSPRLLPGHEMPHKPRWRLGSSICPRTPT
jgi:hypothetical protein